ncbi:SCF-associated factor 1 [Cryptococcus neoformans Bt63]|nr:SCF-associated factor 1 [Cryptococcus neoformans var. grubii Bt63]
MSSNSDLYNPNMPPTLTDLPSEVILEQLLPLLPLKDVLRLSQVNHQLHSLTLDPSYWRHKTTSDFAFSPSSHPPFPSPDWWRRVYFGLLQPRAFVWGSSNNSRLGGAENNKGARKFGSFVDCPAEIWLNERESGGQKWTGSLKDSLVGLTHGVAGDAPSAIGGVGVVELHAGGWSFTARCSDGSVWVWGQLDGRTMSFRERNWENKYCTVPQPTRIPLPCRAEAISAGRSHLLILDSDNLVWELTAWGLAYHHTATELTSPAHYGTNRHPPHVIQLSTGWTHSAALTSGGTIYTWFPFSDPYKQALTPDVELNVLNPRGVEDDADNDARGLRWGTVTGDVLYELPAVPLRPEYVTPSAEDSKSGAKDLGRLDAEWKEYDTTHTAETLEEGQKIIKIASGLEFILALKKNGEVWFTPVKDGVRPVWYFVPYFSSPAITHITAQFESITSYATATQQTQSSAVYHTRVPADTVPSPSFASEPTVLLHRPDFLPDLQNKGIIQVALGDYHYAALTNRGEMLTWGQGGTGQLGLGAEGRRGDGIIPKLVKFWEEEAGREDPGFVFSITAAGWHTGALLLGNNKPKRKVADESAAQSPIHRTVDTDSSSQPQRGFPDIAPYEQNPPVTGGNHTPQFRIGYPGRHMFRGVRGGHSQMSAPVQGRIDPSTANELPARADQGETSASSGQPASIQHDTNSADHGGQLSMPQHHVSPRGVRAMPFFRVGFAGRGSLRGRGRGQPGPNDGNGIGFNPDGAQ